MISLCFLLDHRSGVTAGTAPRRPSVCVFGVLGGTQKASLGHGWDPLLTEPSSHLVRPVLLMNVEDMDSEPVPFLERSFALRAGELPVALVHAGGVLEMLVSVVSVGKHLSTPVTFVPFCRLCQTRDRSGGLVSSLTS